MPLIHACARTIRQCAANLPDAISLHSCIAAAGFGTDPDLGALLIQLYGKCGSVDRARSLFESLPRKSALCWNFVIGAYAGNGRGEESLYLFRRMALEGERPDRHTFVRVLGACTNTAQGTAIHRHISSSGLEFDLMLQNSLVALYGRYGRVDLARSVFQSIPEKSLVSWNAMLTAYARNGHSREAAHAYNEMIFTGIEPNEISFSSVLGSCDDLELGRSIHARTLAEFPAIFFEAMAQTSIVSFYSRLGRVEIARAFLEETKVASVAPWNAMISGYAQHGLVREALGAYHSIDLEGLEPNHRTLTTVLGACSSSKDLKTGKMIHSRAVCCGFDKEDQALQVAVVNFYGKCGAVADARRVFDGIAQKSVVVHTAMIGGYAQHGHSLEALEIYHAMNVPPNRVTYSTVLAACSTLEQGKAIHQRILASKLENTGLVLETALVKMYASFDDCASARGVFDRMERRDLVAWNTMLGGYVQSGRGKEALELYEDMKMDPDSTTLSTLLGACSLLGDLSSGKIFHELLIERKMMQADAFLCSSLVNMYAKCGSVGTAREVFHAFRVAFGASSVLWNTILAALAHTGDSSQSLELLLEMELEGVTPDSTTFVCALVACNHAGLLQRGRVDFAREVVEGMPFEADAVAWKALLGSSRGSIDLEKAAFAAQRLVEMDEELGQAFVLLSNAFSSDSHVL
ncbi:pentatricopeptide repeat-containing protein At5g55740, chloroplastic [Selaginella moellendorffii]|uniref:pentatricopeptide repeat-containing protein At5g55740, chloroplastic n=1 Tax=Selaginella moellendorffii TaxID=88036 RepID=UPI000D1CC4CA|nr:pentatricopeptide repeat-containing protein At5g55740, chloroplastic [Selaginella moellendorffii]|eukprot:XP_024528796.1 pentatricopeptide repeat-containing protein At5g55740, chloroplastic [Selaginella moellendorffii]